jgi:hypothetical protein
LVDLRFQSIEEQKGHEKKIKKESEEVDSVSFVLFVFSDSIPLRVVLCFFFFLSVLVCDRRIACQRQKVPRSDLVFTFARLWCRTGYCGWRLWCRTGVLGGMCAWRLWCMASVVQCGCGAWRLWCMASVVHGVCGSVRLWFSASVVQVWVLWWVLWCRAGLV